MAQLVVAAAGAAIGATLAPGFAIAGVSAAGIGWAAGSAVGDTLLAESGPDAAEGIEGQADEGQEE